MPTSFAIRHLTRFAYASPVSESVMELRMRPASEGSQRCLQFELELQPRARVFAYRDFLGNWVHHFDLPRRHGQLAITARAHVLTDAPPERPAALPPDAWRTIDRWVEDGEHWDFRQPSRYAEWTGSLVAFADAVEPAPRSRDPLTTVRDIMRAVHRTFEYAPNSTRVDSPIDEALAARRGVCQDFTHIALAVLRRLQLPCRYVSGYLSPGDSSRERTAASVATHAWVEVLLPEVGWIGIDPTNGIEAGTRHIRVAVGRDYGDVPPTRGVFKGGAASTLTVSVEVVPGAELPTLDPGAAETSWTAEAAAKPEEADDQRQQMQQQQ